MAAAQGRPSSHYVSQAGLAVSFAAIIRRRWTNLTRVDIYALLVQFARSSGTLAAEDYAFRRAAAGIRSRFTVPLADPPSPEQFASTLNWVFDGTDVYTAEQRAEGALTRLALQAGRETTVGAVKVDPRARAWAREARANCCSFCAMLAGRGAVYKSGQTAGRAANDKFVGEGEGEFKYHNHCHCIAVPVFGVYEPTAHARQWHADWYTLKRALGYSPSLNQWRQFHEDRAIAGLPDGLPT